MRWARGNRDAIRMKKEFAGCQAAGGEAIGLTEEVFVIASALEPGCKYWRPFGRKTGKDASLATHRKGARRRRLRTSQDVDDFSRVA